MRIPLAGHDPATAVRGAEGRIHNTRIAFRRSFPVARFGNMPHRPQGGSTIRGSQFEDRSREPRPRSTIRISQDGVPCCGSGMRSPNIEHECQLSQYGNHTTGIPPAGQDPATAVRAADGRILNTRITFRRSFPGPRFGNVSHGPQDGSTIRGSRSETPSSRDTARAPATRSIIHHCDTDPCSFPPTTLRTDPVP